MSIEAYIENAPEERRDALTRLRQICLEKMPGYKEDLTYNMPSYSKGDEVEVAFASQKGYISLYVLKKPVMDRYRHHFPKSRIGKGCIRYPNPQKIDFELVADIIQDSFAADDEIC